MRVHRPTENAVTQGYSAGHRGYDFSGIGPDDVKAGKDGVIVERVDQYNTAWRNFGALTIADYGNYIKIKHNDGGFELHAHLKLGSSFIVGTKVTAGQTIARIGHTGNSTAKHLHSEYRNSSNTNQVAEFYTGSTPTPDDIDTVRKARDENWNKFQASQKELDKVRVERDSNWNELVKLKEELRAERAKPQGSEKYDKLKQAVQKTLNEN